MMSFCRKSVHSLLGFTTSMETPTHTTQNQHPWKCPNGLGMFTVSENGIHRCKNVLESSSINKSSPSPSPPSLPETILPKKDPGGIGFIDDIGGGVDGLMSCTESLGFESSDERLADDKLDDNSRIVSSLHRDDDVDDELGLRLRRLSMRERLKKRSDEKFRHKKFPPPLSSLNQNGQPSFFLRPVRKEGRLALMEVRIERAPEIVRASRQDGRLRLHLIRNDDNKDVVEDCIQEEDQQEELEIEVEDDQEEEVDEEHEEKDMRDEKKNPGGDRWRFSDGFRRCNELVNHHHRHHSSPHHHLNVWNSNCVTTR